jgi:hypothetical protein
MPFTCHSKKQVQSLQFGDLSHSIVRYRTTLTTIEESGRLAKRKVETQTGKFFVAIRPDFDADCSQQMLPN